MNYVQVRVVSGGTFRVVVDSVKSRESEWSVATSI
jgi:hypothetical protein